MPKPTFERLPVEKRLRFIEIAIEEFCGREFRNASLSKIVARLGIAKGSVYQYFEDKADLYRYLIGEVSRRKLAYVAKEIQAGDGFFATYRKIMSAALRYDLEHPQESSLLYTAGREPSDSEVADIAERILQESESFLAVLIEHSARSGELRNDLPIDFLAFIVSRLSVDIGSYIGRKLGFDPGTVYRGQTPLSFSPQDVDVQVELLIEFFKGGLKH